MALTFVPHTKISLRKHPDYNEAWLHDLICENPSILGLGDLRVLDHERTFSGGGRLDLLLLDEENERRYEVEIMLGATDPSHMIRTIEYWDIERRRYPGYEHIAVLIAEDVTARFLNVMSLFSGSIPLVAIQLDALQVGEQIVLNFVQVLDQTDLRVDDTVGDIDTVQKDRPYWDKKVGQPLMQVCDQVLEMINEATRQPQELNYLRSYMGLRSNGVVKNFVSFSPKRTKKIVQVAFLNSKASSWSDQFEGKGISVKTFRSGRRFRISLSPKDFTTHQDLIREVVVDTVEEFEG